jgi:DNA-binding MarR family transcriptional regulator
MEIDTEISRRIIELFPRFLRVRRRGWPGIQAFLDESGLQRAGLFLLIALAEETDIDQYLTIAEMQQRLFNPYSTIFPWLDAVPDVTARGYVSQDEHRYAVTPAGRDLYTRLELAARAYLTTRPLVPPLELPRLGATLSDLARREWVAPEPPVKLHQARSLRRPPVAQQPPIVQIESAILALWEARDDAHMHAWRAANFTGPPFDCLSRIWQGEAGTLPQLEQALQDTQRPSDVAQNVADLVRAGDISRANDHLALTESGRQKRDEIETETDRIYFAPWAGLTHDDLDWLSDQMQSLCTQLAQPPSQSIPGA